jgi:SAM-dependent methyltransferase
MKSDTCRSCGSTHLVLIHDFGPQPLAGEFPLVPNSQTAAKRFALDLTQCVDCGLLQVTNLPPITEIFHKDYRYSSSTVPDLVRHFEAYAAFLEGRLGAGSRVFEFGCNDGVLLNLLQQKGFECVGIDASDNVATLARSKGLDVTTGFLTPAFAMTHAKAGQFDLVTCSNVFAHIDDIKSATAATHALLRPGGLFIVEVHDGDILATETQFDTIYHEHLTYFTEDSLRRFVEAQGFDFVECIRTPMHGGGLRFICNKREAGIGNSLSGTPALIDGPSFAASIARCRQDIEQLYAQYGPLDGYGAAGRSQMFINMTGTAHYFARVFDDSPFRQDRYIVSTDVSIESYAGEKSGCCVVLAWNYAPSISTRVAASYEAVMTVLPELKKW